MPKTYTDTQLTNVEAMATKPVQVVMWGHSGVEELLSCSGDIVFDGQAYVPGIEIVNIQDSRTATLKVPGDTDRVGEVQNGTYRGQACKIYAIPASPGDGGIYLLSEAVLQIDGIIDKSVYRAGTVTVTVIHKNLTGNLTPRHLMDAVANHIPPAGTQILWESDRLVLETRR